MPIDHGHLTVSSTAVGQSKNEDIEGLAAADEVGMTIAFWAGLFPDAPAVIAPEGDRSFAQLNKRANQLARALRAAGLGAGDSLALVCGNRAEFVEVAGACTRIGVRYTPVNWHLAPAEVAYIVEDCDARAIVAEASLGHLVSGLSADGRLRLAIGGEVPGFSDYHRALDEQRADDIDHPVAGSFMLYTSGTTGRPKGVHRPPLARPLLRLLRTYRAASYRPGGLDTHLCTGPLYHAAPLQISLLMPLADGATVSLMDRWEAEQCLRRMAEQRITHTHMVPTMFHRLLRLPEELRAEHHPWDLRFVVHGAAPCPVPTKRAIIDWLGPIVWEYYSATEGSGTAVSSQEWLTRPGTVGKPSFEDHVRILDDAGAVLPAGAIGTVYIRQLKGMEFHYHKAPEKTAGSRRGDYYTLGDVGYLDADGYLFLTDRSADLIISGGVNIYPAEVEAVLQTHPAVLDVGVIGVPNAEWGEEVKAVVETVSGSRIGPGLAGELIAHCRERLAHFKCPRSVDFIDALPRRDNGKLYKRQLREAYR